MAENFDIDAWMCQGEILYTKLETDLEAETIHLKTQQATVEALRTKLEQVGRLLGKIPSPVVEVQAPTALPVAPVRTVASVRRRSNRAPVQDVGGQRSMDALTALQEETLE